jgi:hypothetical protein
MMTGLFLTLHPLDCFPDQSESRSSGPCGRVSLLCKTKSWSVSTFPVTQETLQRPIGVLLHCLFGWEFARLVTEENHAAMHGSVCQCRGGPARAIPDRRTEVLTRKDMIRALWARIAAGTASV